jgi:hypothetical protein
MPLHADFHSITHQLISPFVSLNPFIPGDLQPSTGLLDFIYQRVSPWSNPSNLQGLYRTHAIGHDKVSTRMASPYLKRNQKNCWHLRSKHSNWFPKTKAGLETIRIIYTKTGIRPLFGPSVKNIVYIYRLFVYSFFAECSVIFCRTPHRGTESRTQQTCIEHLVSRKLKD